MSRSRSAATLPLLFLAGGVSARGEAVLDVSGSVVSVAPRLEVRVVVTNRGDRPAVPLEVQGELLGQGCAARLAEGVSPGGTGAVVLDFAPEVPRPGLHALTLLLEHPVEGPPDGAGNPPVSSRLAWLLVALGGANPGPSVRLAADPLVLDVRGELAVHVVAADGEPHRVHLRALAARGLRAETEGVEVDVPATGVASARLPLVRTGAPRGSRHAVLLVGESLDGSLARTAVLAAPVDVAADPSVLPHVRAPLLVLGLLLLTAAVAFEAHVRFGRNASKP